MSNPVAVHWFNSTMASAPALSGTAGALIGVLDACLINGFGSVTLDSLVIADAVATATKTSHGFLDHTVVLIEGATPSAANGEKRITRVDANSFTFDASGITNQTATGTITAKMAPVGWAKTYSGTNKAAYARTDPAATAMLLRVDDTPAQYPTLIMYETMSDVDTGTGPAPTTGVLYVAKSSASSSATRNWSLFADDRTLYFFANAATSGNWISGLAFGDINSYKSPDVYAAMLIASTTQSTSNIWDLWEFDVTAGLLSRSYTALGSAVSISLRSHSVSVGIGGQGGAYPNPVDNGFHAWPVAVWEGVGRGLMPGLWNPLHSANPDHGVVISDIAALPGRSIMIQRLQNYRAAFDITGPWR